MLILLIYWSFFALSVLALLGCLTASVTLGTRFREEVLPLSSPAEFPSLSMIVPLKGADQFTMEHLTALVESELAVPVEYLFAMEGADDPAFPICQAVKEQHPQQEIRIVLTGPAQGRMGKQHNLAVASHQAHYLVIGSMDADVLVEPDTLTCGLRHVMTSGTGVAYFLPCYREPGPVGGLLVALYSNYYYQLYMGAFALSTRAPFITGALWFIKKTTLEAIGGFEPFGLTVSDDAAIGQAINKQYLRNRLVPRTVTLPFEQLALKPGARQVLKWLTLLRAEGLLTYLSIFFLWHPLFWSVVTVLLGGLLLNWSSLAFLAGNMLLVLALAIRLWSAFLLNRHIYAQPGTKFLSQLLIYELLAAPALFALGLFQHSIQWRGRRYQLGRHGHIKSVRQL